MSATTIAGRATREQRCEKHNRTFTQIHFPRLHPEERFCWGGSCPECAKDEEFERTAREILAKRTREKHQRVNERFERSGPTPEQIQAETDAVIEREAQKIVDEMEMHRPEFEAEVRRKHWETAEQEIEMEMLAEIIQSLREAK